MVSTSEFPDFESSNSNKLELDLPCVATFSEFNLDFSGSLFKKIVDCSRLVSAGGLILVSTSEFPEFESSNFNKLELDLPCVATFSEFNLDFSGSLFKKIVDCSRLVSAGGLILVSTSEFPEFESSNFNKLELDLPCVATFSESKLDF